MSKVISNLNEIPVVITPSQIADILQVSPPTAYRIIKNECIPTIVVSGKIRVYRNDFIKWLKERFNIENDC